MSKEKEFVVKAMENAKGDDLERAQAAFQNQTKEQLDLEYGVSGKTRRQILRAYEEHREEWQRAMDWLRKVQA